MPKSLGLFSLGCEKEYRPFPLCNQLTPHLSKFRATSCAFFLMVVDVLSKSDDMLVMLLHHAICR